MYPQNFPPTPAKENVTNNGEWEVNSVEERRCGLENDDARAEESNDEEAKGVSVNRNRTLAFAKV